MVQGPDFERRPMDGWDWAAILSVAAFALSTAGHLVPADTRKGRERRSELAATGQIVSGIATLVSVLAPPPECPACSRSRMEASGTGFVCPSCGYHQPVATTREA